MTTPSEKQSPDSPDPVEQITQLFQALPPEEQTRLLQQLPQQPPARQQAELRTYFQQKMKALPGNHQPMQPGDSFLKHLTVADFWALPKREQIGLWHEVHQTARPPKQSERFVQAQVVADTKRYLFDKTVLLYALSGLYKTGTQRRLSTPEQAVLSFWRAAARRKAGIFLNFTSYHVLQPLSSYQEVQLLLISMKTLYPTRYYHRWAQRLQEIARLKPDAADLLALATFGTDADGSIIGVDQLITINQPLLARCIQSNPRVSSRLQAMTRRLAVPYSSAVLPEVVSLDPHPLE